MAKEFNRSTVREISQKIQEVLSDYFKTADYEFTINGGNFTSDKVKLNLEVRMKNADGTIAELAEKYGVTNTTITDFSDLK